MSLTGNSRTPKLGNIGGVGRHGHGFVASVSFEVLQHDELPALLALLRPAAAVVLVLLQAAHLHVGRAVLAECGPLGTLARLNTERQVTGTESQYGMIQRNFPLTGMNTLSYVYILPRIRFRIEVNFLFKLNDFGRSLHSLMLVKLY